jgi:putative phosphoesterase
LIAIISDTHMPKGHRQIPERCLELMASSEAIVHAGDISTVDALRAIQALGPPVHAVHGNVDEPGLRRTLPVVCELELGHSRVAVTHDAGPARGRLARLRSRFPDADAVIFGHSHLPVHEEEDGFQIFNPGSPTERRRSPERSMGVLRTERGSLIFRHVWLGGRAP